jgi:hypothetical protein
MGIQSEHPEFAKNKNVWKKADDFYQGEEAVKDQGVVYLPPLTNSQGKESYDSYKNRALFYDATFRTVQGITGLGVWKSPVINVPDSMQDIIQQESMKHTIRELLKTGRSGLLVDMPSDGKIPYIVPYDVSNIINWREDEDGLILVVLQEASYEPSNEDEYQQKLVTRFRELLLDDTGKYMVRIWGHLQEGDRDEWVIEEEIFPTKMGARMDYIPFIFINAEESDSTEIVKPPLLGVVNAKLVHYRVSADYAHGLHWTALPTPWVSGASQMQKDTTLEIGSGVAWLLPETNCRAGYLEFTGQGLDPLSKALEETEKLMASLGARLLDKQRTGVEAAETARIRQSGEMSILGSLVTSVGHGYELAGKYVADWMNANPEDVSIEMNVDFVKQRLGPQELTSLVQAHQSGGLSLEALVYNLETGEMLPPGTTAEEELDRLSLSGPEPLEIKKEKVEEK